MKDEMQSFKTNDNFTLRYIDTGARNEVEGKKPWLILVGPFVTACYMPVLCFVLVSSEPHSVNCVLNELISFVALRILSPKSRGILHGVETGSCVPSKALHLQV